MKEWEKPQLVVLTRSKPEEAVLGWCKEAFGYWANPHVAFTSCFEASAYVCLGCSAYTTS